MDVGVLLADRAEGSLSAGIAQGIDVCGRYVVIGGGLPIAEPDWVVPTRHVVPDWAGLDHGALSSGRLWFQSAGRPPGQATAGCHPQPVQPPGRQGYGGARPVSGFVAFCLGQVIAQGPTNEQQQERLVGNEVLLVIVEVRAKSHTSPHFGVPREGVSSRLNVGEDNTKGSARARFPPGYNGRDPAHGGSGDDHFLRP